MLKATKEEVRLRAVAAVRDGHHPEDVALSLGLHRKSVYRWLAAERDGGREALIAKRAPGRAPLLSAQQRARVRAIVIGKDPRQDYQFDFGLWTRDLVRQVIRKEFGVKMHITTVGRLLRRLGLSPQRPLWRSWKASPEAQEAWKSTIYPAIAAEAKAKGAVVYFGDEASIRADHHAGTTWAPVGKTPVVGASGDRYSVNMISAVTARGLLRFKIIDGTMDSAKFIEFCKQLLADAGRPVVLIVDGHRIHKSKAVEAWVESTDGRFTIHTLPAYSPHLNPDEWVWQNVKSARIGRVATTSKDDLRSMAIGALRRLQKLPAVVRGFFADPDLAYITAADNPA